MKTIPCLEIRSHVADVLLCLGLWRVQEQKVHGPRHAQARSTVIRKLHNVGARPERKGLAAVQPCREKANRPTFSKSTSTPSGRYLQGHGICRS